MDHQKYCGSLSPSCHSTTDTDTSVSDQDSASSSDVSPRDEFKGDIYEQMSAYDRNLWYIHGHSYDLSGFVEKHPGGRLAILSGRGRDCTALFESYHPWNDRHRKVLRAYGPAPPAPDPFYEELKAEVRAEFPGGGKTTKMPWRTLITLSSLLCVMFGLFFGVRTPLACALSGGIMATVGTRLAHEGGHYQVSCKEWVNRLALFLGYFFDWSINDLVLPTRNQPSRAHQSELGCGCGIHLDCRYAAWMAKSCGVARALSGCDVRNWVERHG